MRHTTAMLGNALAEYLSQHHGVLPVVESVLEHRDKAHLLDVTAVMHHSNTPGQAVVLTVSMQAAFELGVHLARQSGQLERVEDDALQELMQALAHIVRDVYPHQDGGTEGSTEPQSLPCAFLGENDAIAFPAGACCEEVSFRSPIGAIRIIVASGQNQPGKALPGSPARAAG